MLLAITSFARSFKEAQAYLIPLMLVSLAPGVASLMPGLELRGLNILLPLLNVVLLSRDLLAGHAGNRHRGRCRADQRVYCAVRVVGGVQNVRCGKRPVQRSHWLEGFSQTPTPIKCQRTRDQCLALHRLPVPIIIFSIMGIQQLQDWTLTQRLILAGWCRWW